MHPKLHQLRIQTACAAVSGEGEPRRVRVLFDAGSHHSFVTTRVAQHAQLRVGSGLVRLDKPPETCSLQMSYT